MFVAFRLQKYLLEKRAVVDVDNGKLLNEDSDIRSVSSNPIDALILYIYPPQKLSLDVVLGGKLFQIILDVAYTRGYINFRWISAGPSVFNG